MWGVVLGFLLANPHAVCALSYAPCPFALALFETKSHFLYLGQPRTTILLFNASFHSWDDKQALTISAVH
jgi:hypothetical protein